MARTMGDVIRQIETRLKSSLKSTAEHQGFVTALGAVLEELSPSSPVLELPGDKLTVLALNRRALADVITAELDRPVGKVKIAERIVDALGELIGIRGITLSASATLEFADDQPEEEEELEDGGAERARGTIPRFTEREAGD
jgi:hypothetical protein